LVTLQNRQPILAYSGHDSALVRTDLIAQNQIGVNYRRLTIQMLVPILLNLPDRLDPRIPKLAMRTTTMMPAITPYSTNVTARRSALKANQVLR
jgi:hypothetical protein